MRSIGFGLYLSVFRVGSFLSALLITIIEMVTKTVFGKNKNWFSDDMREARLDNYYWLLALFIAISFSMFVSMARHYSGRTVSVN